MHKDIVSSQGKVYRIFAEEISVAHPEGPMVAIFDISIPGQPMEILKESRPANQGLDKLIYDAEQIVKTL
jgi:hypothetical protein